jgi:predicted RND superfamily exporter protein
VGAELPGPAVELTGLGNAVRIAVANPKGTIYDAAYLDTLRALNDAVFLLPGVDRVQMKSLWTPATRWVGVTEEGLEGGPVIPDGYDGSARSLQQLQPTSRAPASWASWWRATSGPA